MARDRSGSLPESAKRNGPSEGRKAPSFEQGQPRLIQDVLARPTADGARSWAMGLTSCSEPGRVRAVGALQRAIGNMQVQRMIARSPADSEGMRQGDNQSARVRSVQRQGWREDEEELAFQETEDSGRDDLGSRITSASASGSGLELELRQRLEEGLEADLSGVRIHTGSESDQLARELESIAFTTGSDIFFKSGAFDPSSEQGMRLLAHEATHTVQQSEGPVAGTPIEGGVSLSDPGDSFEVAAQNKADRIAERSGNSEDVALWGLEEDEL